MKKVILLFVFLPLLAKGQVFENFEAGNTGNWTQTPSSRWRADASFIISGALSLHHVFDNSEAATDLISLSLSNLHIDEGITKWDFSIRYGYSPSASNSWAVFLLAGNDTAGTIQGNINGFAVGVNLEGYDDTLRIWKVRDGSTEAVVESHLNWQNDIGTDSTARISVTRSAGGVWNMLVECCNGSISDISSGYDPDLINPGRFIIMYRYTSSCDRLLWFDDLSITGVFHDDNCPPSVTGCLACGHRQMLLSLDEEPSSGFADPGNFILNSDETSAAKVTRTGSLQWTVEFNNDFRNKTENHMLIRRLCDNNGNCLTDTTVAFNVLWPEAGDVIISEIMADPEPAVSLPVSEYIELTNRSVFPFDLKNWSLLSGSQEALLPSCIISPGEELILCSVQDTATLGSYGRTLGIKPFPVLTDAGKILCMADSNGVFIHGVEYEDSWYQSDLKSAGGWSLEMIDTDFPFSGKKNWKASTDWSGGTPGEINSVAGYNPDAFFYGIDNAFPLDNRTIRLSFRESVPPGINAEWLSINGTDIASATVSDPLCREYIITLNSELKEENIYEIKLSDDFKDFSGNPAEKNDFLFGIPEKTASRDILFNELLFNPFPGDPDYIEVYNASGNITDLARLLVASVNDDTGDTSALFALSDHNRCFLPGNYFAFSTDREKILQRYFSSDPDKLFAVESMPSMPDAGGHLILLNRRLGLVDEVLYTDKMHNQLLSDDEGVSLEKAVPGSASGDKSNWHSATGVAGWGTPGAPNS
ncbi:MAG TPA: lamin tail domain-containing protein, partial [Bacteroidales bacterium]|nr:lamin tail domain-containing protein [Bacteroidales bacterium]